MEFIIKNIDEVMARTDYIFKNEYEDERLNTIYNYVYFLTIQGTLVQKFIKNLDTILYTKYYWYTKYKDRYFEIYGKDAGIEQQQFKIIEEIEQNFSKVNWNLIEAIENNKI